MDAYFLDFVVMCYNGVWNMFKHRHIITAVNSVALTHVCVEFWCLMMVVGTVIVANVGFEWEIVAGLLKKFLLKVCVSSKNNAHAHTHTHMCMQHHSHFHDMQAMVENIGYTTIGSKQATMTTRGSHTHRCFLDHLKKLSSTTTTTTTSALTWIYHPRMF